MMKNLFVRPRIVKLALVCVVVVLGLSAMTATGFMASWRSTTVNAYANLQHTPTGTAHLHVGSKGHTLTVTISLTGLAPNSTHPAHIHKGPCSGMGDILYPLKNVVADAKGQASVTTIIHNIPNGIPATGWSINVHNGPTLNTPAEMLPIACGNVVNKYKAHSVLIFLGPTHADNQHATGYAHLQLKDRTLTVMLSVHGLVPGSSHMAHIHAGNCFDTKQPLYDLSPLVADSHGNASKTVTIPNISSIPEHGWDVNVHLSTNLTTQTGFDPILCGNVER